MQPGDRTEPPDTYPKDTYPPVTYPLDTYPPDTYPLGHIPPPVTYPLDIYPLDTYPLGHIHPGHIPPPPHLKIPYLVHVSCVDYILYFRKHFLCQSGLGKMCPCQMSILIGVLIACHGKF